ncbi:MAG TPA: extracellular solute-binding protein [Telmatospirillum sp.]|nr:extracellular solute-binding protein [Telmatospirillum sp.]
MESFRDSTKSHLTLAGLAMIVCCLACSAQAEQALRVYAAGSLKGALSEAAQAFSTQEGIAVQTTFGASGMLRDRLRAGETAEVFASADMGNPQSLADAGLAGQPERFARNRFCALLRPGLVTTSDQLLDTMSRPDVRLGTSTPGADPGGDYAWKLFHLADKLRPGSYQLLSGKALQLVGGPNSPKIPADRPMWAYLTEQADVFLLYCTSAQAAAKEAPGTTVIPVPPALDVEAEYGVAVLKNGGDEQTGRRFASFLLSAAGQAILAKWGFSPR